MTGAQAVAPVEHADSLNGTIDAPPALFTAARSTAKPQVAVAISDTDAASLIGASTFVAVGLAADGGLSRCPASPAVGASAPRTYCIAIEGKDTPCLGPCH